MATVYRARDKRLGREVAIKVIHRHLRENHEVATRFASEALAVAKLKHPNIVEVYDVSSEEEDERYLVVEFVEGITLRQLLTEQGPLPPEVAACIAVEVCRALSQAHRHGVVHRDIKPENVLLKLGGDDSIAEAVPRVKLADFGIAKLLDAQGVTHTGQVLGSPAHMAPEQIEGGDVDARADVFGVGVLLYEMMTGVLPFDGKNPAQVLRRVLEGSFLPPERVRPSVGQAYGAVASEALQKLPEDRFDGARQMGDTLEEELKAQGIADVRAEVASYLREPKVYLEAHERGIVEVLRTRAARYREDGDVVRAAACFNRGLAYRPDDTELLSEVAGLARRGKVRRWARGTLTSLLMLSVVGGLLALILLYFPLEVFSFGDDGADPSPAAAPEPLGEDDGLLMSMPPKPLPAPEPETAPDEPEEELAKPTPVEGAKVTPRPRLTRPPATPKKGVRRVRTPVFGPQNARVRIDGRLVPWFQTHELSLGPHTFEFVPPNSECCKAPPAKTVNITAGDGVQTVQGSIAFRPAVLRLSAPAGTKASCGIGGVLEAGGSRNIPMSRPSRTLPCTIVPPMGSGAKASQVSVQLKPGRTVTLTGG